MTPPARGSLRRHAHGAVSASYTKVVRGTRIEATEQSK
jgi:hypothetical protein